MNKDIAALLRADLRGRSPYGAPQLQVPVRLNTNENSYPLPAKVVDDINSSLSSVVCDLNRYPDRDFVALRKDLASYLGHGLSATQLWAANGSNEILQQLLQAFGGPGRSALGFDPSYSMHPVLAAATGTKWCAADRDEHFGLSIDHAVDEVRSQRPDIVFLCSPNNPTGTALDIDTIAAVADAAPGLVVVDEAYAEFARDETLSALSLLPAYPRLVVTRTMSKAFGFAGARVGYLAADPSVVEALQLVRLPYHLSTLTQAAARAALANADTLLATVDQIKEQRDRIVTEVTAFGLSVVPSDANFVLFQVPTDSSSVWQSLVDQGVLIRDVKVAGWLRVTAGMPSETDAFLTALQQILKGE